MKIFLSIISALFLNNLVLHGQVNKRVLHKKSILTEKQAHECKEYKRYSNTRLWNIEPFKSAKKIEIVSFPFNVIMKFDSTVMKEVIEEEYDYLPIKNGELDMRFIKEKIKIDSSSTLSFMNILFNIGFRGKPRMMEETKCYSPRHAVLFYDNKDSIKPYIYYEICFECQHFYVLEDKRDVSDKYLLGDFCDGKYKLLETLFRNIGIKEGFHFNRN